MKKLRNYLLAVVVMLLFTCTFTGIKAEAAPAKVTGVKQTNASASSIDLEWTALLGNNLYYQVDVSTDKVTWVTKENGTSSNSAYIYGLNAGTSYYVRVCAYTKEWSTAVGNYVYDYGTWSTSVECVTAPNSKPSYLRKTASTTTTMTLKWGKVSGANAYIVEYQPTSSSSNTKKSEIATTNTVKLTKLKKNTTYRVYVYPVRRNSSKSFNAKSSSQYVTEYGLGVTPGKVTGVECDYYWQAIKEISVKYSTSSSAEGYRVEVWTANKSKDEKIASTWGNSYGADITKSVFGKHRMIKIRVRAYTENYDGKKVYGEWSSWKYVCPQPDITQMKSTKTGMKITWDKISGADRYIVYASTKQTSGYKKVATTTKTSYTVKKLNEKALKQNKTYYFYVVAQKKVGSKYYSGAAGNANYCWYMKYIYN